MKEKRIKVSEIVSYLGDKVIRVNGTVQDFYIDNFADVARVNKTSLDWINPSKPNKQELTEKSAAKTILVDESIVYSDVLKEKEKILLVVENPKNILAMIMRTFFVDKIKPGIDSTAYIHPDAEIGKDVYIGPNCYIGKCKIGDNNVIHSNVSIYDRTTIGNNNVIHSGALICVDGLGCMRSKEGKLEEFPQIGGVVIGDNCYIGGNTHIASGSLADTIIEDGCKINGLCFIGSNDHLHENVWITGSTMLAGSVTVEKNTTIYSRVVVREWTHIGEGVTIGMGSVVTKNIPDGETWVGTPAHKMEKRG